MKGDRKRTGQDGGVGAALITRKFAGAPLKRPWLHDSDASFLVCPWQAQRLSRRRYVAGQP